MTMTLTTLTVKEIVDLANFAGLTLDESHMPDADEMETEIAIGTCPAKGIHDDDEVYRHHRLIAWFDEYPEEGCVGLGDEIKDRP